MDIYVHILRKMGFKVSDTTYFMVCNGEKNYERFDAKINFTIKLVPYVSSCDWIPNKLKQMKSTLDSKTIPKQNIECEKCVYMESYNSIL